MKKCWWYWLPTVFYGIYLLCVIVITICSGDRWYVCEFNCLGMFSCCLPPCGAIGEFRIAEEELSTLPAGGTMTAIRGEMGNPSSYHLLPFRANKDASNLRQDIHSWSVRSGGFLSQGIESTRLTWRMKWWACPEKTACPLCPTHRQNASSFCVFYPPPHRFIELKQILTSSEFSMPSPAGRW